MILGVAHGDPFVVQIGPEKAIFGGFIFFFFLRTTGLLQKLILIESPNIFHWKSTTKKKKNGCSFRSKIWAKLGLMLWKKTKETGIINGLFSNFEWEIHLKARSSDYRNHWVETEDQNSKKYHIWRKLKLNFCLPFLVKNSKKRLFWRFLLLLVSPKVT